MLIMCLVRDQAEVVQPLLGSLGPAMMEGQTEGLHILSCLAADPATLDLLVASGLLSQVGLVAKCCLKRPPSSQGISNPCYNVHDCLQR